MRECHENETRLDNKRHEENSQNLGDIFRLSAPESPDSFLRGELQTSGKDHPTEANTYSSPFYATTSPCRTPPLFELNSEDGYPSEEEMVNQKACPRLWTIDVSERDW
jgi:hypothetical protein